MSGIETVRLSRVGYCSDLDRRASGNRLHLTFTIEFSFLVRTYYLDPNCAHYFPNFSRGSIG